jgi:hypothetical protein
MVGFELETYILSHLVIYLVFLSKSPNNGIHLNSNRIFIYFLRDYFHNKKVSFVLAREFSCYSNWNAKGINRKRKN